MKRWFAVFALATICGNATTSHAAFTTYLSQPSFSTAAGATVVEDFNSYSQQVISAPGNASYSKAFSAFTVSGNGNGDWVGIATGSQPAAINATNYLQISQSSILPGGSNGNGNEGPTMVFSFATPITAFGFDWRDTDPTDSYKLVVNGVEFANPPFSSSGTGLGSGFFGLVATGGETFTSISLIQNTSGGIVDPFGIDNVRTSVNAVPEPSSVALALSAAPLGLVLARRRWRSR